MYFTGKLDWSTKLMYPVDDPLGWTSAEFAAMQGMDLLYLDTSSWWNQAQGIANIAALRNVTNPPRILCYINIHNARLISELAPPPDTRDYNYWQAAICQNWIAENESHTGYSPAWVFGDGRIAYHLDPYLVDVDQLVQYQCSVVEALGPNCGGVFLDYWTDTPYQVPGYELPAFMDNTDWSEVLQQMIRSTVRGIRKRLGWARLVHVNGRYPIDNPHVALNPNQYATGIVFENFRSLWYTGEDAAEKVGDVIDTEHHHTMQVVLLTLPGVAATSTDRYIAKSCGRRAALVESAA